MTQSLQPVRKGFNSPSPFPSHRVIQPNKVEAEWVDVWVSEEFVASSHQQPNIIKRQKHLLHAFSTILTHPSGVDRKVVGGKSRSELKSYEEDCWKVRTRTETSLNWQTTRSPFPTINTSSIYPSSSFHPSLNFQDFIHNQGWGSRASAFNMLHIY